MYLKTELSKIEYQYETYYQKIDESDTSWEKILDLIERELEAHYCAGDGIVGIKFNIEIVKTLPDDVETWGH